MKYQVVVCEELDRRIRRIMPFAMFREVSEFVREALRFYVEKLEDNYKLELQEAKEHG